MFDKWENTDAKIRSGKFAARTNEVLTPLMKYTGSLRAAAYASIIKADY